MKLLLLDGPPGSGKSTLARRYADDHPPTLALDVDRVRATLGGWRRARQGCWPATSRRRPPART
ncbi:AAA family ATPase [Amycolatopsis sp. cmx-4-83]|uniref:AAA family ATPase n=1 Tax=Amycolatopsis sp. cmx-4-83 TaxID=2790940 RepID=UPI00397845FD